MSSAHSAIAPSSSDAPPSPPSRPADGECPDVSDVPSSPPPQQTAAQKAGKKNGQALVPTAPTEVTPPDPGESKIYKVAIATIALRAQGVKTKAIAEQLGYPVETIRQYLYRAFKKGWINLQSFDDPEDQLDYVLKSKVTRNVAEFLDERDKDVTLEAAKGLGLFKSHQVVKGETTSSIGMSLRVQVEMPPSTTSPITIRPGTIGGANALDIPVDAEFVEES